MFTVRQYMSYKKFHNIFCLYGGKMMKKRKIALALGLCTVVGLSAVGLAACGEKPAKPGSKSEYYIVGLSSSDIFGGELDWAKQHKDTVAEIPDAVNFKTTKTSNVYELTVDLYENDEFQIVIAGKGWTGQMGYEVLASDQQADGVIEIPGGGTNSNFKLDKDGRYTFTLTVNGEGANKVTYTRTDEQAKLPRVVLNKSALVLTAGGEETLTATLKDTETPVVWSSDKPEIATVDPATGKVTGVSAGKAVITAKSGDATASCTVTVAKAAVNYYIVGESALEYFPGWNVATDLDKIHEKLLFVADDTATDTYVLTTNLYSGTKFKVLTFGNAWDGALGHGALDAETKEEEFLKADGENIEIVTDGSYQLTITETAGAKTLKIERKGDAPALAWSYDIYAKGSWHASWGGDFKKINGDTPLDKENLTCTGNITLDVDNEFGLFTSRPTGDPAQVGWGGKDIMSGEGIVGSKIDVTGNNAKCTEAGTYNVTVTLNAGGGFVSIVFNSFTPAA